MVEVIEVLKISDNYCMESSVEAFVFKDIFVNRISKHITYIF